MTDEQAKILADAIHELAKAIGKLGDCIAEGEARNRTVEGALNEIADHIALEESLDRSVGKGLDKIAEAISRKS
jgi:hypothetical protein